MVYERVFVGGTGRVMDKGRVHGVNSGSTKVWSNSRIESNPGDIPSYEGLVAVSHSEAAKVGRHVLASGGNAVDAAIAVQFALNVVEPCMSGIGGGTYVTYYDSDSGRTHSFDARETSSLSLNVQEYSETLRGKSPFSSSTHGHAVGVPGTVRLLNVLGQRFGTIDIAELIEPSIRMCVAGVRVDEPLARYLRRGVDRVRRLGSSSEVFSPGGRLLQGGDVLVQEMLGDTLRKLQVEGLDAFYEGEIAQSIVDAVAEKGGAMTLEDLATYSVKEREPLWSSAFGLDFASMGPSSSGGITLMQILRMMESFDFDSHGPLSAKYIHRLVEVMHLAYGDRVFYIGDPDFCTVPVEDLLDYDYLKSRLSTVKENASTPTVDPGILGGLNENGVGTSFGNDASAERDEQFTETSHFSIIDKFGNMIAFTTSIGQVFGSAIDAGECGFLLNGTSAGFDIEPGRLNSIEPGKRPLSSMSPTLVFEGGRPVVGLGSPGATTIIGSVAQVLLNAVGFRKPLQGAILTPRVYSSSHPRLEWEAGVSLVTRQKLLSYGHAVEPHPSPNIGDVHAVQYDWATGSMYGASDDNRDGTVLSVEGHGRSFGQAPAGPESESARMRLVVDGVVFPLHPSQVFESETDIYLCASLVPMILPDCTNAEELSTVALGGRIYSSLNDACKECNAEIDVNTQAAVAVVDTRKSVPLKNAVQLRYSNERSSITR